MPSNNRRPMDSSLCNHKIRFATLEDLENIFEIEIITFRDAYSLGFLYQLIRDRNSISLIIEVEQIIAGFAFGNIQHGKKGHIISVAVHPKYRNCNFGSLLVAQLISILKEKGAVIFELEVRVSNIIAQKLYKKFNFRIEKTKSNYYSDGEDAYFMVYKIK
ncbi:MAG: ribosomal protein S18-alanine N-acetyltransferase [Promethearchaeota archaeon]